MNLHSIVRPAVNTVNPEFSGTWRESTGFTQDATGRPVPQYTDHAGVPFQVQALAADDLIHTDFISQQGVKRTVYAYGNIQGVVRPNNRGGDLLLFPEVRGGPNRTWLVTHVLETWNGDWCRVGVVLQTDATP